MSNPKNLFLMDIAQLLWSETDGQAQPVLSSQVQSTEELNHAYQHGKNGKPQGPLSQLHNQSEPDWLYSGFSSSKSGSVNTEPTKSICVSNLQSEIDCGPKTSEADCVTPSKTPCFNGIRVSAPEAVPSRRSDSPKCSRSGKYPVDVTAGSSPRTNRVWESEEREQSQSQWQLPAPGSRRTFPMPRGPMWTKWTRSPTWPSPWTISRRRSAS